MFEVPPGIPGVAARGRLCSGGRMEDVVVGRFVFSVGRILPRSWGSDGAIDVV